MGAETWPEDESMPISPDSLRRGILWGATGQAAARILGLVSLTVLARLIAPRDFGLLAIGTAVIAFATQITEIGVASALVQRQGEVRDNASAAFYMNATVVVLCTVALVLLSGTIARFFDQPLLAKLIPVLSASFLMRSSMYVHEAYLRKRMLFRRLHLINIASAAIYGAVAIPLAASGAGVWSFAWGQLAASGVYAGSVLAGSGMPLSINPHLRQWRGLFVFGRWVFLGGIAAMILTNSDNVAVGKFLGPASLGVYALAYNYGLFPFILIGGSIGQAAFPVYSRLQNDRGQLEHLLMKVVSMTAVVSLPIAGAMLFASNDLLVALLGPKWTQAGPLFCVFGVVFTTLMFAASFPRVYDAIDRPAVNLYICVAALPVMALALAVGLQFGLMGVALGISAMQVFYAALAVFAVRKTVGISVRTIMGGVWPPAVCTGCGVAAGMLPFVLLRGLLPSLALDAIACLAMLGVYVFSLRRFFPSLWLEALSQGQAVFSARSRG